MSTKERLSADYTGEVESPFLDEELFVGESEEEWEPRAAALAAESPFQSALEQGRGHFESPEMEEPESFDEELFSEGDGDNRVREKNTSDEEEHFEFDVPALRSATNDHPLREIADGQRGQLPDDILAAILTKGESDAKDLTDRVFSQKHTDLSGKKLKDLKDAKKRLSLQKEWGLISLRQVKPIIWLRQLIDQLDRHRGDIPREFLLGWIAAESDGKVSTVSTLGERGYFQVMWEGGEARDQLGLTRGEFLRLSTDREFSIEKGVQLAKTYRQHFLRKYPTVPNGSDLLWRLTKGRHGLPTALDKVLDGLVKAGTRISWASVSQSLPKMASSVNLTFDFAAKLKPLADRVPQPAAPTPELLEEFGEFLDEGNQYAFEEEENLRESDKFGEELNEEGEGDRALAEYFSYEWEPETEMYYDGELDGEMDGEEEFGDVAGSEEATGNAETDAYLEFETAKPPKGLKLSEHYHIPKKLPDGTVLSTRRLDQQDMNPGFVSLITDDLLVDRRTGGLQTLLDDLITTKYPRFLATRSSAQEGARAADRIRVALVDLSGSKLFKPDIAGWGSTLPTDGASVPKICALYAVHQLRSDLIRLAAKNSITKKEDLIKAARASWKKI